MINIEDEVPDLPSDSMSGKQNKPSPKKPLIQGQMSLDPSRMNKTPVIQTATLRNKDKVIPSGGIISVYPHQQQITALPQFCISTITRLLQENTIAEGSRKALFSVGGGPSGSDSGHTLSDKESPLIEIGVEASAALDQWVNVDVFDDSSRDSNKQQQQQLELPPSSHNRSMRGSLSDSALSDTMHSNMESLIVSAGELDRDDAQSAAHTFARVRMRVGALPVTPGESVGARRKAILDLAISNKKVAQKMFRQCKSKIILL